MSQQLVIPDHHMDEAVSILSTKPGTTPTPNTRTGNRTLWFSHENLGRDFVTLTAVSTYVDVWSVAQFSSAEHLVALSAAGCRISNEAIASRYRSTPVTLNARHVTVNIPRRLAAVTLAAMLQADSGNDHILSTIVDLFSEQAATIDAAKKTDRKLQALTAVANLQLQLPCQSLKPRPTAESLFDRPKDPDYWAAIDDATLADALAAFRVFYDRHHIIGWARQGCPHKLRPDLPNTVIPGGGGGMCDCTTGRFADHQRSWELADGRILSTAHPYQDYDHPGRLAPHQTRNLIEYVNRWDLRVELRSPNFSWHYPGQTLLATSVWDPNEPYGALIDYTGSIDAMNKADAP